MLADVLQPPKAWNKEIGVDATNVEVSDIDNIQLRVKDTMSMEMKFARSM